MFSEWNTIVQEGEQRALGEIRSNYELVDAPLLQLPFHNTIHTREVRELADRLVQSILAGQQKLFSPKEVTLLKLSALFHDIVQEWEQEVSTMADTMQVVKRKRRRGYNEEQSALRLQNFLHEMNGWHNQEIFTEGDYALVQEAILATVPEYCEQLKTVIQPRFTNQSTLFACVLALADLGRPGSAPERFIDEGYRLFREDNLDMILIATKYNSISPDEKKTYRERMIMWGEFQVNFAQKREELLEDELHGLSVPVQKAIRSVLNRYADSISLAQAELERMRQGEFEETLGQFGYQVAS